MLIAMSYGIFILSFCCLAAYLGCEWGEEVIKLSGKDSSLLWCGLLSVMLILAVMVMFAFTFSLILWIGG